jgi:outer membrane scaffolding protein for murein synthesis (MipA/OmpV family)
MRSLALSTTLLLATLPAQAQDTSGLPLWEVGVFGGVISTPAYPGSSDRASRGLALPVFVYRGEIFRADNSGFGARVVRTDSLEVDVGFSASLPASSESIAARRDMPDLGTLVEFGPRLKWTITRPTPMSRIRLELPLRAVLEFRGGVREQGVAFEPTLIHESRDVGGGWSMSTSGSLVFGDTKLNVYFYGVDQQFAVLQRPTFEAQGGLIATRLGFSTSKKMTQDLRVFGFARFESYAGSANRDSPLFLAETGTSIGVGLNWTLGRSASRVPD